jgi:sucrose phosphorylase
VAHGASLIRLDAIGYLWKEIGTRCIHLPQAHRVVQLWRAALDVVAPDVLLITETNVPHADNISYFGDGANEAQLVYQFPLAPLVLHAFATGDASRLSGWAQELAPPTESTAFFNFLASHDGIGVVPATGILSVEEVGALCAQVERHGGRVSYKNNPDGSQSPYELNCTWFDALNDPAGDEPQGLQIDRFICSQAVMLALQGVPGLYIHSMVGSPNDQAGLARTGRARTLNREKWELAELRARVADPARREGAVLRRMIDLLRARRGEAAFHPKAAQRVLALGAGIFALERHSPAGKRVLCLHNVASVPQHVHLRGELGDSYVDLISGDELAASDDGALIVELRAYQARWLKASGAGRAD